MTVYIYRIDSFQNDNPNMIDDIENESHNTFVGTNVK